MERFFVLSGCSGGGKSTLIAALAERGYATVAEPGRRVLRGGGPKPWEDLAGFLRACLDLAIEDHARACGMAGPVIFDRCAIDAMSGLAALGEVVRDPGLRYASPVFLAPPWPELFASEPERRHGFAAAVAEYERLSQAFPAAGYAVEIMPKASVAERVA
ncbi:AAA family ATPase [Roseicyclus marinus]|uniref:AAA family ATPase n=1 Tax=Roseicyclus marinus TaxID=2161673 RepID=UPI0024101814|nr:AAA family ATPase [Roseicyclus marinus]MDG3042277.1 AAA family ATPase [Roseicyclus marinus]